MSSDCGSGDRLTELDREIAELERASGAARVRVADEEIPLGFVSDPALLESLEVSGLGELAHAVRAVDELNGLRRSIETELTLLPTEAPRSDLERLSRGAALLRQWLTSAAGTGQPGKRIRVTALAACRISV